MAGLLFDLDGTLALTNPVHERAWRQVLLDYGLALSHSDYTNHISGRANAEIVRRLLPDLGSEAGVQIAEFKEATFRQLLTEIEPPPGLVELLRRANALGLRAAVVTNAPSANAVHVLRILGLEALFELVIGVEHVTRPKPDAEPYELAAARLGLSSSQCVAFEDSPSGIKSAVAAGIPVAGMLTGHEEAELLTAGAEIVAPDFADPAFLRWIERFLDRASA